MEVFWSLKDLSMDNVIATKLEQCFATMDYCNNFRKKWVSCREKDLLKVLSENVDEVENLGDVRYGFHDREINLEMRYTLDDHGGCFIEGFGFNYDNQ